ncbi:MAG: hypothetical protein OP8BY_1394 [Candidatus Saccharicenans subterraneus]|uniref:6-bladed beta-propeller n=1 Tax=Candidatus Saccharicenans subterraneus TaxID=2508984 RepID=A0A3E2BQ09_9BACT|nr:MAG: hypothetical protein OP8BY_1394 [Candidatus Saccharicenans subterraneum]
MKREMIFLSLIVLIPISLYSAGNLPQPVLRIKDKIQIRISPTEGSALLKSRYEVLPILLTEGYQQEILIWRGTYLEVFSKEGQFIKRVGREGEGPGEFSGIIKVIYRNGRYYILDFPNKVSIFDREFNFIARTIYAGKLTSPFIHDFDINESIFVAVQRNRPYDKDMRQSEAANNNVISIYSLNGEYKHSFFPQNEGWAVYPEESLLGGHILLNENKLFFVFNSINKIWMTSLDGKHIRKKEFGKNWWKPIIFNQNLYREARKAGKSAGLLLENALLSGDVIDGIYVYKDDIAIKILRTIDGNPNTFLIIIKSNLINESDPIYLNSYQFCYAGKNDLYFYRYLSEYNPNMINIIEIVKCDI